VFGVYDGFTGLVTQPIDGWQEGDTTSTHFAGMGKGVAKGVGGFVLKNISAIITPPAFLTQGVRKDIERRIKGPSGDAWIRKAHIIRGQKDLKALSDGNEGAERLRTVQRRVDDAWRVMNEVWATAEQEKKDRGKLKGSLAVRKEKKKWEENGALENISATHRALETRRKGHNMEDMFKQRRKELAVAEQPRASAIDQPQPYEHQPNVKPNGKRLPDGEQDNSGETGPRLRSVDANVDTDETDSTAVATPDVDTNVQQAENIIDKGMGAQMHPQGVRHATVGA